MADELLAAVEREVLGWPGVTRELAQGGPVEGGFWVPPATVYRLGRRHLGHIHEGGVADLTLPRAICDELIASGRAEPHGAGFPGVVSYRLRAPEDVPGAIALFRLSYDRARESAERRGALPAGRANAP
jgi:hypothetical protein